jgi:hypothetical protein
VLTLGSGKMSNIVVRTLFGHGIFEVGGKISGTVPLEQIVEQDGVVCSVCVSHKTKLLDAVLVNSPGAGMSLLSFLLSLRVIVCKVREWVVMTPEVDSHINISAATAFFQTKSVVAS